MAWVAKGSCAIVGDLLLEVLEVRLRLIVALMNAARLRAVNLSGVEKRFFPSERSSRTNCWGRRSLDPLVSTQNIHRLAYFAMNLTVLWFSRIRTISLRCKPHIRRSRSFLVHDSGYFFGRPRFFFWLDSAVLFCTL